MTWELTTELGEQIYKLIVEGCSLRKIGRMEGMPSRDTIMRWERENKEFAANIARAREAKYEDDIEELEEINEALKSGKLNAPEAQVISNNLKWVAQRLLPKKYGESSQLKLADNDGNKLQLGSLLQAIDGRTAGLPDSTGEAE